MPLHTIAAKFNHYNNRSISVSTLNRYLHSNGIRNYGAVPKPYLTTQHLRGHIKWARPHLSYFITKACMRIAGRRRSIANLFPNFKSGFISISVQAAFSARGRTPLIRIQRTLDKKKYENILETVLLPFIAQHHSGIDQFIFQQDDCGSHRAKSIKASMDAKQINRMDCPSQSPDLNPIENAWALLKRRLLDRSTHPTNADDLFQILCNMWNDIPHHHFTSLVHSKPCWATLVLRNKGQSIKYCVSNTKSEIEKNLPGF